MAAEHGRHATIQLKVSTYMAAMCGFVTGKHHPDLPAVLIEAGVDMDSVRLDYLDEVGHG
jgi:hypothetical protein